MDKNLQFQMKPLVSIIIPVYNAEAYINETIRSALNQTWLNTEIIIVDDGSTDNSLTIAKQFENEWIKVFTQQNKGASTARNKGLLEANGEYIQFLDADDILSNDKIESQLNILNNSQDYICLCGTIYFKDGTDHLNSSLIPEWFFKGSNDPADFLLKLYSDNETIPGHGGMVQPNAWLTPRKLIDKAGLWKEFKCPDDDGEYFCRVILESKGVKFSSGGINYYRKHDNNQSLSGQRTKEAIENMLISISLKYKYLKSKTNSPLLDIIFSRHYWEVGVAAFPKFKTVSDTAIQKAKKLGFKGKKYHAGKISSLASRIFGWRVVRILSFLKYEL